MDSPRIEEPGFEEVIQAHHLRSIRTFYEHLRYKCNQPNVLVSSIDSRDVEVTTVDLAATLKCSHEPPKSDVPWIDCPSMLTIKDIVSDMCEGQYANKHQNAASKAKIPWNLWFVDVVLYRNVCPLGHRGGTCSSVLYTCSTKASGAPFPRSYGDRFTNFGKECTIEWPSTQRLGVCLSLFSSLTY
jgi:hypothetical protein